MSNDINQDIAKELVAQTAGKAYEDVAHPTAHATGKLISFIPRTIKVWLGKWEKWILNGEYAIKETEMLLAEKLKHIPEEKIVEPEPYVAVPALQQLSYSLDSEELRELYANLLASSMNIDTKSDVHPAFVDIIKQLAPDEARLLNFLCENGGQPLIDVHQKLTKEKGYILKIQNFTNIAKSVCVSPQNIYSYINNLERLMLIEIPSSVWLSDDVEYEALENEPAIQDIKSEIIIQGDKVHIAKKVMRMTKFGEAFCEICI